MKPDDFEQRLMRQPIRSVPTEWRQEILQMVVEETHPLLPSCSRQVSELLRGGKRWGLPLWLNDLLWPCPQAWAGLAAIWIVILGLNIVATDSPTVVMSGTTSSAADSMIAMEEKRRLLAELLTVSTEPVEIPRPAYLGPRSELIRRTVEV